MQKISAGFGISVAMVGVIFLVYERSDQGTGRLTELLYGRLSENTELLDLQSQAYRIRTAEVDIPKFNDIWPVIEASDAIQLDIEQLEKHLVSVCSEGGAESTRMKMLLANWHMYRASLEQTIRLAKQNDLPAAATNSSYLSRPRFDSLLDKISRLSIDYEKAAREQFLISAKQRRLNRIWALGVSAAGVLVALVSAILLARSLSRRVRVFMNMPWSSRIAGWLGLSRSRGATSFAISPRR